MIAEFEDLVPAVVADHALQAGAGLRHPSPAPFRPFQSPTPTRRAGSETSSGLLSETAFG
jgi:hypothetical protein